MNPIVAGKYRVSDWQTVRSQLADGAESTVWGDVFEKYFVERLRLRYFDPVSRLQAGRAYEGEGFAIIAIDCTLIEFLESTYQGVNYKLGEPGAYEYSRSGPLFVTFLSSRPPFRDHFDEDLARDFYEGVRCGVLHEARTKKGWIVRGRSDTGKIVSRDPKTVYRDNFHNGLLCYVQWYKAELLRSAELQSGFIRKFEVICS